MINSLIFLTLLKKHYPEAKIALNYTNTWELLVSVILSAQCTDIMVNKVTDKLFVKYKSVKDYGLANLSDLENDIRSTGFYRNKAKNIQNTAKIILQKYQGKVPGTMDDLVSLPGVARKTANVVLGNAYAKFEGVAVDTHVKRLSQRMGFTMQNDPDKIEQDLMKLFNQRNWFELTYLLIEHGRKICQAKKPKCSSCFLNKICPSAYKI